MLFELRTYDFAPGKAVAYLDLFGREGLPLITRYLPLGGYWMSEIGTLNRLRHLWLYRDLQDRSERRSRFLADQDWTEGFLPKGLALIGKQSSQLLQLAAPNVRIETIVPEADQAHAPVEAGTKPLRPVLSAFILGGPLGSSGPDAIEWTVIAGEDRGAPLALQPNAETALSVRARTVELVRSTSFSPL
jgi:hypothetical protein